MKRAVPDVPVFAVHRILTPDEAEGILEHGDADAVTIVRALIADPEWATKARDRRAPPRSARCTGCNQGCYGNLTQGYADHLRHQPERRTRGDARRRHADAGRDARSAWSWSAAGPAGSKPRGSPPRAGHDVTLLERASELGGKIRLAALLPGRAELAAFADWRADECARRGVDVRLGVDADRDAVLALEPDAVVVATGGRATCRRRRRSRIRCRSPAPTRPW